MWSKKLLPKGFHSSASKVNGKKFEGFSSRRWRARTNRQSPARYVSVNRHRKCLCGLMGEQVCEGTGTWVNVCPTEGGVCVSPCAKA